MSDKSRMDILNFQINSVKLLLDVKKTPRNEVFSFPFGSLFNISYRGQFRIYDTHFCLVFLGRNSL